MKIILLNPNIDAGHKISRYLQAKDMALIFPLDATELWQTLQLHGTSVDLLIIHLEDREGNPTASLNLIEKIKSDLLQRDLPIVLTTAKWSETQCLTHQASPQGVNAYLIEPVSEEKIWETIQSVNPQHMADVPPEFTESQPSLISVEDISKVFSQKEDSLLSPEHDIVLEDPEEPQPPGSPELSQLGLGSPEEPPQFTLNQPILMNTAVPTGTGMEFPTGGHAPVPLPPATGEIISTLSALEAPARTVPSEAAENSSSLSAISIPGLMSSDNEPLQLDGFAGQENEKKATLEIGSSAEPVLDLGFTLEAPIEPGAEPAEGLLAVGSLLDSPLELGSASASPSEMGLLSEVPFDLGSPLDADPLLKIEESSLPASLLPSPPASPPTLTQTGISIAAVALSGLAIESPSIPQQKMELGPPEVDHEVAQEMPYLFTNSSQKKGKQPPPFDPAFIFAEPMGNAVVPGGAAHAPDLETFQRYLMLREQDVAVLSNQLKASQDQTAQLQQNLREEKARNAELSHITQEQKAKIDSFNKEKEIELESLQNEIRELRFQSKAKTDKARIMENQVRDVSDEMDHLKERVRSDIRKIRVREKELENRLEIVKKDSEALISGRENKITELKRKLDLLEFNMDLLQDQCNREKENAIKLRERLAKAAQVVRVAGGLLDSGQVGGAREMIAASDLDALVANKQKAS
jgi:hypothetical protein